MTLYRSRTVEVAFGHPAVYVIVLVSWVWFLLHGADIRTIVFASLGLGIVAVLITEIVFLPFPTPASDEGLSR